MHLKPSLVYFQKINGKSSIDHLLDQICEGEIGDVIGFLELAFIVFDTILISLNKLLCTCLGKFGKTKKFMGCRFQIYLVADFLLYFIFFEFMSCLAFGFPSIYCFKKLV